MTELEQLQLDYPLHKLVKVNGKYGYVTGYTVGEYGLFVRVAATTDDTDNWKHACPQCLQGNCLTDHGLAKFDTSKYGYRRKKRVKTT